VNRRRLHRDEEAGRCIAILIGQTVGLSLILAESKSTEVNSSVRDLQGDRCNSCHTARIGYIEDVVHRTKGRLVRLDMKEDEAMEK
jgi:hypothetical protein